MEIQTHVIQINPEGHLKWEGWAFSTVHNLVDNFLII